MLIDAALPPVTYKDPWSASFEERIQMLGLGDRRVAYVYEQPDTSTFRYRVYNMIEALQVAPSRGISASWFTRADLSRSDAFLDRADVLVICRTRYDEMVGRLISRARARRLPILYDVDDLIFDPNYAHLIADTLDLRLPSGVDWDNWFGYIARLGATLRNCDGAITTNAILAERITDYAPWIEPRIVPNFLNRRQTDLSRRIYDRKKAAGFRRDRRIHIGYFSGTPTHNKDFRIVSSAVKSLLENDRRINLRVVGFLELTSDLMRYRDRVEFCPLQDFINLQRLQGEVEINIAPLQSNVFTHCKSELKYFEAAIAGTVTVASPATNFARAIADGKNGFLAGAYDWENKIGQVVALLDDRPHSYASIAEHAFIHAERTYGCDRQAAAIEAALFGGRLEHQNNLACGGDCSHSGKYPSVPHQVIRAPTQETKEPWPRPPQLRSHDDVRSIKGKPTQMLDRVHKLRQPFNRSSKILEVGPSFNPIVPRSEGWQSIIVDHTTKEGLVQKYESNATVDISKIEEVDYVWQQGYLHDSLPQSQLGTFDACLASHVIEHIPDLIGFLLSLDRILHPQGVVSLAVPDKRFCFDYFKPITTTGELLSAHAHNRLRHSKRTAFDNSAYNVRNNGQIAWGQHPPSEFAFVTGLADAKRAFDDQNEGDQAPYVDFHAWYFTPASFELIILELAAIGVIDFHVAERFAPEGPEFIVILRKGRSHFTSEEVLQAQRLALLKGTLMDVKEQISFLLDDRGDAEDGLGAKNIAPDTGGQSWPPTDRAER